MDLNADVGESPSALADGSEERLIAMVSSVNVACGGHAGDHASMHAVVMLAMRHGVAVGAHPAYPDRRNFGRRELDMSHVDLTASIKRQVTDFVNIAGSLGTTIRHIKPHGALYNAAAHDRPVAELIGQCLLPWRGRVHLVGLAGSIMLEVWASMGFRVAAEAFADRRYEPDGRLRSREHDDALIHDKADAARQAIQIAEQGTVLALDGSVHACRADTICLHGDAAGAMERVIEVRRALEAGGIRIAAPWPVFGSPLNTPPGVP